MKPPLLMIMNRGYCLLLGWLVLAATVLRAHTVWIEPKDDRLVIRFAEPGKPFETSPGYLDSLSPPCVFYIATNKPARVEAIKQADHLILPEVLATRVACAETVFTVRGGRKPYFYARWQPSTSGEVAPLLTLDLVPTGKPGEARVYFRGKPLPDVGVTLRSPDDQEQKLTADGEGFVRFTAAQPGQYLLTVAHYREPLAGFYGGVAYTETSHNCSLVWRQK
jgi:hypothetical protein